MEGEGRDPAWGACAEVLKRASNEYVVFWVSGILGTGRGMRSVSFQRGAYGDGYPLGR